MKQKMDSNLITALAAVAALLFSAITYRKTQNQLIDSQDPLLSFHAFSSERVLYLTVTNKGKSAAQNIKLDFVAISNNGYIDELMLSELFVYTFDLFPDESLTGRIGLLGQSITTEAVPMVDVDVSFHRGDNQKSFHYCRKAYYSAIDEIGQGSESASVEVDGLNTLVADLRRIANYLDGSSLAPFDQINLISGQSLRNDLYATFIEKEQSSRQTRESALHSSPETD